MHIKFVSIWPKYLLTHAHRVKLHLISRESASFVRKDVMNHSKVLNNAHVLDRNASTFLSIDHSPV